MSLSAPLDNVPGLYTDAASVVTSLSPVLVWVVGLIVLDVVVVLAFTLLKGGGSLSAAGGRGGSHGIANVRSASFGGSRSSAARAAVAKPREFKASRSTVYRAEHPLSRRQGIAGDVAADEERGSLVGHARTRHGVVIDEPSRSFPGQGHYRGPRV